MSALISIHALRMEGDKAVCPVVSKADISIHALRMEGDTGTRLVHPPRGNFNPRPPHGGRQMRYRLIYYRNGISIHALRMEGDNWKE